MIKIVIMEYYTNVEFVWLLKEYEDEMLFLHICHTPWTIYFLSMILLKCHVFSSMYATTYTLYHMIEHIDAFCYFDNAKSGRAPSIYT